MTEVTSIDVAQHVYNRLGWVDAWRLQKLVYFAQAWHLAWDGRPLFADEFQAWPDGPVARDLHRINKYERDFTLATTLPGANVAALSAEALQAIDAVLDFYGGLSTQQLIDLTHADSPWLHARAGLGAQEPSARALSKAEMRRCYTAKAASGSEDIPKVPAAGLSVVSGAGYSDAVSRQLDRWSGALALLADR